MLFIKRCSGELCPLHNLVIKHLRKQGKRHVYLTISHYLPIRGNMEHKKFSKQLIDSSLYE